MSLKVESLEEVSPVAPNVNDEDDKSAEESRTSFEKSGAVDDIANEDSRARRNSVDEANGAKFNNIRTYSRNSTYRSTKSDIPIDDRKHDAGESTRSSVQKIIAVDRIANEDSQAPHISFDEAIGVKLNKVRNDSRNSTFRSTNSELPIVDREHDAGERSRSSFQKSGAVAHIENADSQALRNSHDEAKGVKMNNIRTPSRQSTFRSTSFNLPMEDRERDEGERSKSSVEKSVAVDHIAIEDSQDKRNSLDDAIGVQLNNIRNNSRNSKFQLTSFDLPIEDKDHDAGERSRWSVEESVAVDHIAIQDSQAKRNSLNEAIISVKSNNIHNHSRNSKLQSSRSDPPIEDKERDASFVEERRDEMQQLLGMSESEDQKSDEKIKSTDCAEECFCKIKQALGLIVEEIKKVDTAIEDLSTKDQCPYVPKPDDKKEFAKSVRKNSSVCHVIIGELKKQRIEIDEMLQLFEDSTRDFSKMEATLSLQREKIEHMDAALASAEAALRIVKEDIAQRQESFQLEMKSKCDRAGTREEILSVFLNWISSLEAKRYEEREASDLRMKEAIEERDRDRTMLTLAVRQLREVRRVEILLIAQRAAMAQGKEDTSNGLILGKEREIVPASFCRCSSPIGRVAVISGQSPVESGGCGVSRGGAGTVFNTTLARCAGGADRKEDTSNGPQREMIPAPFCGFLSPTTGGCGPSRGKAGTMFNNTMTRCAGGADGFGTAMTFNTGLKDDKNWLWNSQAPVGYQIEVRRPRPYQRRVPNGRKKSPTNNSRRHRRIMKNVNQMQKTTAVRHCI